jgi:thiol-disulfide isomerase/thioredoxin/protocatechuate 3,4-dioxygenase beta subunit
VCNAQDGADNTEKKTEAVASITLKFLGPAGKPIPNASALAWSNPKPKNWKSRRYEFNADKNGVAVIPFEPDDNMTSFNVNVKTAGFTPFYAEWKDSKTDPVPNEYTFNLDEAETVGSIVVDDAGKPVAGVKVSFSFSWANRQRIKLDAFYCSAEAVTDKDGYWSCGYVPVEFLDSITNIAIEHPNFKRTVKKTQLSQFSANSDGKFASKLEIDRGVVVKGQIKDESGKPIKNAIVHGTVSSNHEHQKINVDEDGCFEVKNWADGREQWIIVTADGFAPDLKSGLWVKAGMPSVDFTLKKGNTIKTRVVDVEGKPVADVRFFVESWRNKRLLPLFNEGQDKTGADGWFIWRNAPADEVVVDILPTGKDAVKYKTLREQTIITGEEKTFTTKPSLKVTGKVFDAKTHKPIPKFEIHHAIQFNSSDRYHFDTYGQKFGKNGEFEFNYPDEDRNFFLKVAASGYAAKLSGEIDVDQKEVVLEFALAEETDEPKRLITGIVLAPNGKPVKNATVALAHEKFSPYIQDGLLYGSGSDFATSTNSEGRFTLPAIGNDDVAGNNSAQPVNKTKEADYKLFVLHSSGYAEVAKSDHEKGDRTIKLGEWAKIEGIAKIGENAAKSRKLSLSIIDRIHDNSKPHAWYDYRTVSDKDGKFVFGRVPPKKFRVGFEIDFAVREGASMSTMSNGKFVNVSEGETVKVQVGGVGCVVVGKLAVPSDFGVVPDWNFAIVRLTSKSKEEQYVSKQINELSEEWQKLIPDKIKAESDDKIREKLYNEWKNTTKDGKRIVEIEALIQELQRVERIRLLEEKESVVEYVNCAVDPDGNFCLEDVPAGDWDLTAELDSLPPPDQCGTGEQIGNASKSITIPETPAGQSAKQLDQGTITLEKSRPLIRLISVGADAPDFELQRLKAEGEAETIKLSNYRGKIVILDFWATWCGPCLAKLPELTSFYEKYKDNKNVVLVGASLDNEDKTVLDFLKRQKRMNWTQIRIGSNSTLARNYGVLSIPALIVIAPDGKVLAVNPKIKELETLVNTPK